MCACVCVRACVCACVRVCVHMRACVRARVRACVSLDKINLGFHLPLKCQIPHIIVPTRGGVTGMLGFIEA